MQAGDSGKNIVLKKGKTVGATRMMEIVGEAPLTMRRGHVAGCPADTAQSQQWTRVDTNQAAMPTRVDTNQAAMPTWLASEVRKE